MLSLLRVAGLLAAESSWFLLARRRWTGALAAIASAAALIALGGAFLALTGFIALSEAIGAKFAALVVGGTLVVAGGLIALVRGLRRRSASAARSGGIVDMLAAAGRAGAAGDSHDVERAWDDFRRTVRAAPPAAMAAAVLGLVIGLVSLGQTPQRSP